MYISVKPYQMIKRLANSCWNCWILKILQWFSLYMNENYANYANIHERNRESVICWSYRWETQGANVDSIDEAKPSLSIIYIHTESFPYVTPTYGRLFFFGMNFLAFICKNLISWRHQELQKNVICNSYNSSCTASEEETSFQFIGQGHWHMKNWFSTTSN